MQADLFEYFASHGHNSCLADCTINLTDKADGADPTRREGYWRRVLKTVSPYLYLCLLLYTFPRQDC